MTPTICVFEGPDFVKFVELGGGRRKQIMSGWVHVLMLDVNTGRFSPALAMSGENARRRADANGYRFFPRGSWESGDVWRCLKCRKVWPCAGLHPDCDGDEFFYEPETRLPGKTFAAPRREILDEIGGNVREALGL